MKRFAVCALCLILFFGFLTTDSRASADDSITFHSQREYEVKIANLILPKDFLDPDRFHMLGTLTSGSIYSSYTSGHVTYYYYFTNNLSVRIEHNLVTPYYNTTYFGRDYLTEIPEGTRNMLYMKNPNGSNKAFCYFRNGLYYTYDRYGSLNRIYWITDSICFALDIPSNSNYLTDSSRNPIPAQLLSATEEVADNAFQALCDELGITPDRNHYTHRYELTNRIVKSLFIVGIPGAVLINWLIAKWRRTKGIGSRRTQPQKDTLPFSAFANHESTLDTPNTH